jgi:acyl carrier protein
MPIVERDVEERVIRVVGETFPAKGASITQETLIKHELGADSMQVIALMIALDAEFDVEFAAESIPEDDVTVGWICAFVQETLRSTEATQK